MPMSGRTSGRFIYMLIDPRDNTIRYLGSAVEVEKGGDVHSFAVSDFW